MREKLLQTCCFLLEQEGFLVSEFSGTNSCFDIAARRGGLQLLVKVLDNVDSFREQNAKELQKLAHVLDAAAVVVGEKTKAFSLKEGVVFERYALPVVGFGTFKKMLSGELPKTACYKGRETVEIDSEKLRRSRMERELSLRELGKKIGATTETIYRYEHGYLASQEKARKLEKELGEKLVKGINVFERRSGEGGEDKKFDDAGLRKLHQLGVRVSVFEKAPFEAFGKEKEDVLVSRATTRTGAERRARALQKTRAVFESHPMLIAKEARYKKIEKTPIVLEQELKEMKKGKELLKLLKEREDE